AGTPRRQSRWWRPESPGDSLETQRQPRLENLIEASLHLPPPHDLKSALLGQGRNTRRHPPQARGRVIRRTAPQRESLLEQQLAPERELVLDVARVRQIGLVIECQVPVGVRSPGHSCGGGERKERQLLGGEVLHHCRPRKA